MMAKPFIAKVIRVRKAILKRQRNCKPHADAMLAKLENWFCFWNPNEVQCLKYVKQHSAEIEYLIPGAGSTCREKLLSELHQILSTPC